jgi:transcription antitermination factor NusG
MCTDADGVCALGPLAMLRLQDNPPATWPLDTVLTEIEGAWTVAYCKPRQEKALAWDLIDREVSYFLPLIKRETSSGGRRRRNFYPLFPSYVFFVGREQERLRVLRTDRVVRLIEISQAEQERFRDEISVLAQALESCPETVEVYPRVVPGARVRITSGPLKDVEGVVIQAENKRKLWLGVSVLGVGATVEIHADLVQVE